MKAVVLMAGRGTRMAKDYDGPKHLLPIAGKPLVEHALDQLPEEIDEFIFVVGGPHEQAIRDYFGENRYNGRSINFVVQEEQLGLAHAFKVGREFIKGKWLGMVGDDIFGPKGMKELVNHDMAILASRVDHPESFGVLVADDEGYLVRAVEKPKEFVSDLVWNGAMVMDEKFLDLETAPSARGEYETPDVWMKLIREYEAKIRIVEADFWLPVNDRGQLEEAEKILGNEPPIGGESPRANLDP